MVSVIVPVYNGEKHLRRCIDSVFGNDFDDFEILLLNDGSSDTSGDIIAEYERERPETVRAFSHGNMGVARTRNKGIDLARGKHILFLDQDDWFDKGYIRAFYDAIEESGSDVVVGGYKRPDASGRVVLSRLLSGKGYYQYITAAAWGKIHRGAFLKENGIEFFDNNIGEDVVFSTREAILSDRFSFIPYVGYNWYLNKESVSETDYKGFRDEVKLFAFLEKLGGLGYRDKALEEYFIVKSALYYLMHSGRTSAPERYKEVYAEIMGWIEARYPGFANNRFLNRGLPGESFKVRLAIRILMIVHRCGMAGVFAKMYCKGMEVQGG